MFLTRTSYHKLTHTDGYCGAWPGWAILGSVLPLTEGTTNHPAQNCAEAFLSNPRFPPPLCHSHLRLCNKQPCLVTSNHHRVGRLMDSVGQEFGQGTGGWSAPQCWEHLLGTRLLWGHRDSGLMPGLTQLGTPLRPVLEPGLLESGSQGSVWRVGSARGQVAAACLLRPSLGFVSLCSKSSSRSPPMYVHHPNPPTPVEQVPQNLQEAILVHPPPLPSQLPCPFHAHTRQTQTEIYVFRLPWLSLVLKFGFPRVECFYALLTELFVVNFH